MSEDESGPREAARPGRVVQVALPLPPRNTFSYAVPGGMPVPGPGCRVFVPFGRTRCLGYVVEGDSHLPQNLREIQDVLDQTPILSEQTLHLTRWIADYYLVSWGMVLKCAYPSGLDPEPRSTFEINPGFVGPADEELTPVLQALSCGPMKFSELKRALGAWDLPLLHEAVLRGAVSESTSWEKRRRRLGGDRVALLITEEEAEKLLLDPGQPKRLMKPLKALLARQEKGFPTAAQLAREARVQQFVVGELAEAGIVELFDLLPTRLPGRKSPHSLTGAQEAAVRAVSQAMDDGRHQAFLLFGVTGSGKTEVYLRLIEKALSEGGGAIYLVPEISLASFLARRLIERLGSEVAILHSSMNERERVRQWLRIDRGSARVVIGPRSALFAPLGNLKLVVVDEEHDQSYKQQEFPRYHARDMAVLLGVQRNLPVVLGSATPSVESYYNATDGGKYTLLALPERAGGAALPEVETVDMRKEFEETGQRNTLSRSLESALQDTLEHGRQAVLLRNRLGYATFVLCRACGRTVQCGECSIAMTFHRRAEQMRCHYCGRRAPVPMACPHCGGEVLQFLGEGTEKVEDVLSEKFPAARVERMDRDAVRNARRFDSIWRDFEEGKINILAGTQMVAKGHDIHNVTLVGILSADFLLGMPDFRSAERTFQLITQAAGRAGRGERAGRVVLQSFHPDHYAVRAAFTHDYAAFYREDIRYRKMVGYPPCSALARVEFRHKDRERAESLAQQAAVVLRKAGEGFVRLLGPVEPPLEKLEGRHRLHILLKSQTRKRLQATLAALLDSPLGKHSGREISAEIDPHNLM